MLFQLNDFEDRGLRPGVVLVACVGLGALVAGVSLSLIVGERGDPWILKAATLGIVFLSFVAAAAGFRINKLRSRRRKAYIDYLATVRNEVKETCRENRDCIL